MVVREEANFLALAVMVGEQLVDAIGGLIGYALRGPQTIVLPPITVHIERPS